MAEITGLNIHWTPSKGETSVITAEIGGSPVLVDQGNIRKQKFRENFITNLVSKYPAVNRQDACDELLKLAAEASPKDEPSITEVVGNMNLVRPERFILPEVNGLLCPVTILEDGQPAGRWKLYLRWNDGRREERDLEATLELGDNQQVYFFPTPSNPLPGEDHSWSMDSRKRWLAGEVCCDQIELFWAIYNKLTDFLDFDSEAVPAVLTIWIIMTYNYQAWDNLPYLNITGPLGSGKSQVLDCLGRLVYRPLISSSISGPALFRTLHDKGGTLILDEAERLRQDDQSELLTILLAGYKRGGKSTRLEKVGDGEYVPKYFDVFGPKALGGISSLPPALASRCIQIPMFRSGPESDKPRRRLDADPPSWQRLRDNLYAMALEYGSIFLKLANDSSACPADFGGRNYQLWQPIFSIGKWLEGFGLERLVDQITDYARRSLESAKEGQTSEIDEIVLMAFAEKIKVGDIPRPSDILMECQNLEPNLFNRWTPRGISGLLGRYGFHAVKSGSKRSYRHTTLEDLKRVQINYGIELDL